MSWKPKGYAGFTRERGGMTHERATKHIVFDWNGTLLDDIQALHECTNKLLESEGHAPMDIEYFRGALRYSVSTVLSAIWGLTRRRSTSLMI